MTAIIKVGETCKGTCKGTSTKNTNNTQFIKCEEFYVCTVNHVNVKKKEIAASFGVAIFLEHHIQYQGN